MCDPNGRRRPLPGWEKAAVLARNSLLSLAILAPNSVDGNRRAMPVERPVFRTRFVMLFARRVMMVARSRLAGLIVECTPRCSW